MIMRSETRAGRQCMPEKQSQREKFEQPASEQECDESDERWDASLTKIAKQKPPPKEREPE